MSRQLREGGCLFGKRRLQSVAYMSKRSAGGEAQRAGARLLSALKPMARCCDDF